MKRITLLFLVKFLLVCGDVRCPNYPKLLPLKARTSCKAKTCTVICIANHQFPDGSKIATLSCTNGNWMPTNTKWKSLPDCQPICNKKCENGGTCISFNTCHCQRDFRGAQCQYRADSCSPGKLNFNGGGYDCDGDAETFKCSLSCPDELAFEFPPSPEYSCEYRTGAFLPAPVPQCLFPKPGTCITWQGHNYKTFDGKVFSLDTNCPYTLLTDRVANTFSIVVGNNGQNIKINYQNRVYELESQNGDFPTFSSGDKILPIPGQLPGLRIEMVAQQIIVVLDTIEAKLKWDRKNFLQIDVTESLWNRLDGLCGNFDGVVKNDVPTPSLFKISNVKPDCVDKPLNNPTCNENFCQKLLEDQRFQSCHNSIDYKSFLEACKRDYCTCGEKCACDTIDSYVKACTHEGFKEVAGWRNEKTCPMRCPGGRLYYTCEPAHGQPTCYSNGTSALEAEECIEGCYCPEGTVLYENSCILKVSCPCSLRGKDHKSGSKVQQDCNMCTCSNGQWDCTKNSCGGRCTAWGDPHYTSFDGKRYDFMGRCTYYLLKGANFSIEGENVPCPGGRMPTSKNPPVSLSENLPSCTNAVIVRMNGHTIKLKQNQEVTIDGTDRSRDIQNIPYRISNIEVRTISSLYLQVELANNIAIRWAGGTITSVDIDVPAKFNRIQGLCGTFNATAQSAISFGNQWKSDGNCGDVPDKIQSHPCDLNPGKRSSAEKHCNTLKTQFTDCHSSVDPESYYQNCLYDMCSCESSVGNCLCATLSAYSDECTRKGVTIDWRLKVKECGLQCPAGQVYQICGNSCARTCYDISTRPTCIPLCVDGCNCPSGYALQDGECVPTSQCQCYQDDLLYQPGYKEIRRGSKKDPQLCTCLNGQWICKLALQNELDKYPNVDAVKELCKKQNMEFTSCAPSEPITCKNMHISEELTPAMCQAGCKCQEGFVLDSSSHECVKATTCPCYHGGKSHEEDNTVTIDCNSCSCRNGKWSCTTRQCWGECSAWGESHFKTFDSKHYDYQGQCDYTLAKGSKGSSSFDTTIQNVPCGTLGTSCSKSITIRVKNNDKQDKITLTKDKMIDKDFNLNKLKIRNVGLFVIIEERDLGLVVHWDRGTKVYVRLVPDWKGQVSGLCGNYNGNQEDDFQTPSGGISEKSPLIFGDSWKVVPYCAEAREVTDTCEQNPERKEWALDQCRVLKSTLFAPCHSEVPIDLYLEKCIFDSCACDQGGDERCLCTAISVYAQECTNRGIPIKWRSQDLCPIQCDESFTDYSPCISPCPVESCENNDLTLNQNCKLYDTCIEGCAPKACLIDHIYFNSSKYECVPKKSCKSQLLL